MKHLKTYQELNEGKNNKMYFFSKNTKNLLIEIEQFGNTFVYWTYNPSPEDEELMSELSYNGSNEISYKEGYEMISYLKSRDELTYDGYID